MCVVMMAAMGMKGLDRYRFGSWTLFGRVGNAVQGENEGGGFAPVSAESGVSQRTLADDFESYEEQLCGIDLEVMAMCKQRC